MAYEELVKVNLKTVNQRLTAPSFSIPAIFVHHTGQAPVKTYVSSAEVSAEFGANHPATLMATALMAASDTKISQFRIIKMTNQVVQSFEISDVPSNAGNIDVGKVVSFKIRRANSATVDTISYTIEADKVTADILAALEAQIEAIPGLTSAVNAGKIEVTADNIGDHFYVYGITYNGVTPSCSYLDTTGDVGYGAAFDAAVLLPENDWYGVLIEHPSNTNIDSMSLKVLAGNKTMYVQTASEPAKAAADHSVGNAGTYVIYNGRARNATALEFPDVALMGYVFAQRPGYSAPFFATPAGMTPKAIPESELNTLLNARVNVFWVAPETGALHIPDGVTEANEFVDRRRLRHWLLANLKVKLANLLVNGLLPYDDVGKEQVRSKAELFFRSLPFLEGEDGGLVEVQATSVTEEDPEDKAARITRGYSTVVYAKGFIHRVAIDLDFR